MWQINIKEKPICFNCLREIKRKKATIIEIFEEMPWANYQDISQYVDCNMDMVKKMRDKLIQMIASKLSPMMIILVWKL